jgi:poly(3-hydroxyalkanoate) depolymerase
VDVLGVSFGGVLAQQLAHQAPGRVRRLVLAATGAGLGGVPGSPRVLLRLATPRRYTQPDYFRRIAGDIYGGAARRDPDAMLHGSLARFAHAPSPGGYFAQLYAITGWSSLPWLRRLPQRTLVISGDDDPIVPLVNGRILHWLIPDARLHIVRGGGHLFLLEQPAAIAAIVTDFLTAPESEPGRRSEGRVAARAVQRVGMLTYGLMATCVTLLAWRCGAAGSRSISRSRTCSAATFSTASTCPASAYRASPSSSSSTP